jgi:hypothetical protein
MTYASVCLVAYVIADSNLYKSFRIERNHHGNNLSFYDAADYGHSFSSLDCPKIDEIICLDQYDRFISLKKNSSNHALYWWDHKEQIFRNFKNINSLFICDMRYPEDLNVE